LKTYKNYLKYLLCTIVFCLAGKLSMKAQITFQKTYGGIGAEYAYEVQQTNDNGYIIAGVIPTIHYN